MDDEKSFLQVDLQHGIEQGEIRGRDPGHITVIKRKDAVRIFGEINALKCHHLLSSLLAEVSAPVGTGYCS